MQIDVVMACYNSEATIGDAIESFLEQHHPDKRLFVMDGGSTDGTLEIIRSARSSRIRLISQRDDGIYDAMNRGLDIADGDAVGFLNSDDTYHSPSSLADINEALQTADIVYGDILMVTDHDTKRAIRVWRSGRYPDSGFHRGWFPPHPTFYVRRNVVTRIGGYDLRYRFASDYDFMLRAMSLPDVTIRYIPKFLIDFKLNGVISHSLEWIIKANLECLASRRRNLGHPLIDFALIARPMGRVAQIVQALRMRRRGSVARDAPPSR